jgi:gliding motility-associated-like protein
MKNLNNELMNLIILQLVKIISKKVKNYFMKNFILSCISILFFTAFATAQEFAMTDGNFTACAGSFTDSGGLIGNYTSSEDSVITFCSPFVTDDMQITFNSFALASGDLLFVYDGDDTTAPLTGVFLGMNSPGVILASAANTSGCITFRFRSDSTNVSAGWEATVACIDNCQTITSSVISVPAPDADNVIRICQGETVNFTGSANFSVDSSGATYVFVLSDGTEVSGFTASETFAGPGIYRVDFVATDPTGCRDRSIGESSDVLIQVSTTPDFTGTQAADTSICFGESTDITGLVETTEFFADVAPPITGQTFLPDGNGVAYQTCIDVSGFNVGTTFQSASDLISVFINMEHSYMGDLDITLTAPDGSQVNFLDFPNSGGGRFLGQALDDNTNTPGVGETYTFTEGGTATATLDGSTAAVGFGAIMPPVDYLPEDPFSNFIGTPLNGLWCLDIVDNLGIDNGYIFEWGINFNPAIIPTAGSYEPGEVSEMWEANADITATNANVITVTPTVAGQNCYNFSFTDSFGCSYIETVCIDVAPEVTTASPNDIIVCQPAGAATVDLTVRNSDILNGLGAALYTVTPYNSDSDAQAASNPIPTPNAYNVSADETVFVRVEEAATGCFNIVALDILYTTSEYNAVADLQSCDDPNNLDGMEVFDLTAQDAAILGSQSAAEFSVNYFLTQADADANINPIMTPAAFESMGETIFVRVSNSQDPDCFATGTFDVIVNAPPSIGTAPDVTECDESPIDGATAFDFSVNDTAVLNGQSATAFGVSYHTTQSDADAGSSSISATSIVSGGVIYARLVDNATGCYNTSTFNFVVETCEVEVPEGFSPNNDTINDTFSIPGIDQFSNFELKVFNRLGSVVYETRASNYVEFAGIPNSGLNSGDGLLPTGTYFYVIKFNDASKKDIASWVYINY